MPVTLRKFNKWLRFKKAPRIANNEYPSFKEVVAIVKDTKTSTKENLKALCSL